MRRARPARRQSSSTSPQARPRTRSIFFARGARHSCLADPMGTRSGILLQRGRAAGQVRMPGPTLAAQPILMGAPVTGEIAMLRSSCALLILILGMALAAQAQDDEKKDDKFI